MRFVDHYYLIAGWLLALIVVSFWFVSQTAQSVFLIAQVPLMGTFLIGYARRIMASLEDEEKF